MQELKILVVPKLSKVQLDMHHLRHEEATLRAHYHNEGLDADRLFASHARQQETLQSVLKAFGNFKVQLVGREMLTWKLTDEADLVIALGGDNHFAFVASYCFDTALLGINSDSELSHGGMLNFGYKDIDSLADALSNRALVVSRWTRLVVNEENRHLGIALSEVFLGNSSRFETSRLRIQTGSEDFVHKGSGVLIATGAGSNNGSWYDSASAALHPDGNSFSPCRLEARVLSTEAWRGNRRGTRPDHPPAEVILAAGQELIATSYMYSGGIAALDPKDNAKCSFNDGKRIRIRISDKPLNAVVRIRS